MDHIEPEELAVLALDGGQPEPVVRDHLSACEVCAAEYAALARTVDLGRDAPDDELEAPPSAVWSRIHDELGLAPELATDPLAERGAATAARAPASGTPDPDMREASSDGPGVAASARRHVVPRRPRTPSPTANGPSRRRLWWGIAAAAAVIGLVAGVGIGVAITGVGRDGVAPDASTVLATAELDAFPGWDDAVGTAVVEEDVAGDRTIVVDLATEVPAGEVREVWLIRADASGLVSLGLMDGDSARLAVPAGIDLAEYPLVDVSAEPVDGDPAHSGDSIVRGELSAA
ncbi:anti-sigma factor domain-containing protein [Agromyces sp. GXQ0307]|uniref:anti-sigma factor n=1 Tax=Agromyces sp. GXQ0307 TaxID=3377835 RepID=UPI003839F64A